MKKLSILFISIVLVAGYAFAPAVSYAASKDDILLVNKNNSLSSSYVPDNLVYPNVQFVEDEEQMQAVAATALEKMFAAANGSGLDLFATSGYRSYDYQADLHQYYVNQYGKEYADRVSAEAGHSEHQTGLAMDVTSPDVNYELVEGFGNTDEGEWLEDHAHEYGFIIRYPQGKESITGYKYEPWHLRYVGEEHATKIANNNLTLEEYLNVGEPSGNDVYIIQKGDTLWGIAREHNMSLDKLMSLNPNLDPYRLMVGDKVNLSSDSGDTNDGESEQPSSSTYTIKSGDTLWGIAQNHQDVTTKDLLEANPSVEPTALQVGSEITLPNGNSDESDAKSIVATGNVWIHSTPDFKASSRVGVFYEGETLELIGETDNMYQTPKGYVSKHYAQMK